MPKRNQPARQFVERGDFFRQQQRVAFGDQADPGAELEMLGHRRGPRERDKRIENPTIGIGDDAIA